MKDSKVRILENDYEMFKMKPNESIVEMFTRFTDVVNGLEGLGCNTPKYTLVVFGLL